MRVNLKIKKAECDTIRSIVSQFVNPNMNGLDIGSGGAPLFIQSISLDRTTGHLSELVQLKGDARNLHWFKDNVLDYVFSSHCWEDFTTEEKPIVLREWVRVIKSGGYLILYLPDEQAYRKRGANLNLNHKDPDFNMKKAKEIINTFSSLEEVFSQDKLGAYSFLLVYKKK